MIEMIHVHKTYPSKIDALSDLSLKILRGEFTFVEGPSGSGKTTLLRILSCAEKPTRGEVRVNGIPITARGFSKFYQLRRTMGIVFQDFKLLKDRTVGENVALALEVAGHSPKEIKSRVSEMMGWVGLQERAKDSILSLSSGEQQRVAIARALVNDPSLLLADEPTGYLDERMTNDVMLLFRALHEKGTTVVFATQDRNLVERYPYPVIRILNGKRVNSEAGDGVQAEA